MNRLSTFGNRTISTRLGSRFLALRPRLTAGVLLSSVTLPFDCAIGQSDLHASERDAAMTLMGRHLTL
jgi:hypothetical protein